MLQMGIQPQTGTSPSYIVPIRKPREAQMQFSIWKRVIFRKIKEIKDLSGGVVLYAAQLNLD